MADNIDQLEQWLAEVQSDISDPANAGDVEQLKGVQATLRQKLTDAFMSRNAEVDASKGIGENLLVGIGSGMNRVAQDVGSLGALVPGGQTFGEARKAVHEDRALMDPLKARSQSAGIGEMMGEIASTLPLGGVTGVTSKGIGQGLSAIERVIANMGLGATSGALGSDDPLTGALWAGTGTGLMEGAGEGYRAWTRSRMPGAASGVELLPSDVFSGAAQAEGAARSSLFGGGQVVGARAGQEAQIERAVSQLTEQNPASGADVLDSMRQKMKLRKGEAGLLYDDVEALTSGVTVSGHNQDWRTKATQTVLDELRKPEGRRDDALVNKLRAYLEEPNDISWGALRTLRSDLKGDIRDAYRGTSQIGSTGVGALEATKNALEADMRNAIPAHAQGASDLADRFYRTEVAQPYGRKGASIVRSTMGKETSDQAVNSIISPAVASNPELVGRLSKGLTEEGRQQVRAELVQALRQTASRPDGTIDPHTAANFIRQRKAAFEHFLPGQGTSQLADTMGSIAAGSTGTLPTAGIRVAAAGVPLLAGALGAASVPGGDVKGDIDRAAMGGGWLAGALGVEAGLAGVASAIATGRPGPVLNASLRTLITTKSRLADSEEEETVGVH